MQTTLLLPTDQKTLEDREKARKQIDRLRWVINLRWMAVAGITLSDVATQIVKYTESSHIWPWLVIPLVLGYNLFFLVRLRQIERGQAPPDRVRRNLYWQLYLQALCDILALNLLVYLNGGIEYPLFYAPLLAVMLTGLLLPGYTVFLQANLGAILFAALASAESQGWIPHHLFLVPQYQHNLYRDPNAVLGTVLSMTGMLNVAALLVFSMGRRLRRAETGTTKLLWQLRWQVGEAAGRLAESSESLQGGAEQVGQVAEQIASTVQQIAQGAGQQAAQLEKLSHNLEDLANAGLRVAEGAQETHQTAGKATTTADDGRQAARQATARMEEIVHVFAQAEQAMTSLAHRSEQIAEVAATIDRFAERTDLLALNAGIEAARAGEHGRGFAVVASEVKKLAASSSASAEQVAEMVAQVRAEIAKVVQSVQAGVERVRFGQQAIATLQQVLDGMVAVISRTDELAGLMEHLAQQQQEAHQQIVHAAEEIASAAEETAAGAEETAAAVEEQTSSFAEFTQAVQDMAGLAAQLNQAVTGLTEENGAERSPAAPEADAKLGSNPPPSV